MRKQTISLFLFLVAALTATAAPVSVEKAREIALNSVKSAMMKAPGKYKQDSQQLTLALTKMPEGKVADGTAAPLFYVFNKGANGGFVVVAGDDRMRPVLGYTDDGQFTETTDNPGLRWWLEAVAQVSAEVSASSDNTPRYSSAASNGFPAVEPLIQTKWYQMAPYDRLCPEDPETGGKTLTGCVATAMAQVFYYWKYPSHGTGEINYTTATHGFEISDNLENYTFDYDVMQLEYDGTETGASADAVAKLMYACGIGMDMDYTVDFSGTNLNLAHLIERFDLDASCAYASRSMYTTAEWENIILTELSEGRPVFYSGFDCNLVGHQFICDGYDGEGLYHINWGWGGFSDGFFDLASLEVDITYGNRYPNNQDMVYGVRPDTGDSSVDGMITLSSSSILSTPDACHVGDNVSYSHLLNAGAVAFDGFIGTALYDADGQLVDYKCDQPLQLAAVAMCEATVGYVLPDNLADGEYKLYLIAKTSADDDFVIVPVTKNIMEAECVVANVSGGNVSFSLLKSENIDVTIEGEPRLIHGMLYPGCFVIYELTLKNNGDYVNDLLVVSSEAREDAIFYYNVELEPGETKNVNLAFTTYGYEAGMETLKLLFESYDGTSYQIGTIDVITDIVAPEFVVEDLCTDKQEYAYGEPVTVGATLTNLGVSYAGRASFRVTYDDTYCTTHEVNMYVGYDESTEVTQTLDITAYLDYFGLTSAQCRLDVGYYDYFEKGYIYDEENHTTFNIGTPTGIDEINVEGRKEEAVYSITGAYVGKGLDKLPKGVYIVKGKKVVVK